MSRIVHVTTGSSAAACVSRSGVVAPHDVVVSLNDDLSCGPLSQMTDLPAWRDRRLAFWRSLSPDIPDEVLRGVEPLADADHVRIWLGTSLSNQMTLAFLPALLRRLDASPTTLELVQFEHVPSGMAILDVAILSPQHIAAHPEPSALTGLAFEELEHAWRALTSDEPRALVEFVRSHLGPLPVLRRSLRSLLRRYPDAGSGVNAMQHRALRWVRNAGPNATRVMGCVLAETYGARSASTSDCDAVGDLWLYSRMLRLADPSLPEPALTLTGERVGYRGTTIALTAFGDAILAGQASFVDTNGIDDWVAGVHLDSRAGCLWVHRDGELLRSP
jgi:hypothetical protein